jgi:DNA-binding NarL/FixJ family response regulator
VLVIYLSEVVSGNYQSHLTEAHRQAKKSSKENIQAGSGSQLLATLALARETKQANIEVRRNEVAALIGSGKSYRQIAGELGVGLATVKRDAKALNGRGHYEG